MTALYLGIILFGGIHLFSILLPQLRDTLKTSLGEKAWKGLYTLISIAGLGLMIYGFLQSRSGPLAADLVYYPPDWARHVTMLFVLIALILLVASHGKGYLKTWLHNPMSLGIAFWSSGHLLANGKRTDVYLFGTFLVLALADIVFSELRGKRPAHVPRVRSDIVAVVVGIALYLFFLFIFHPYILNLPVVQ